MTIQSIPAPKKLVQLNFMAPISGESLPITQHSDPAISHGLKGQGLIISPLGSRIVAPCDGIIIEKSATNHQLIIQVNYGVFVELTYGSQALTTYGVGFSSNLKLGQHIKTGETLIELDLLNLKKKLSHFHVAMLVSNGVVKTQPHFGAIRTTEDIALIAIIKPK